MAAREWYSIAVKMPLPGDSPCPTCGNRNAVLGGRVCDWCGEVAPVVELRPHEPRGPRGVSKTCYDYYCGPCLRDMLDVLERCSKEGG